MRANPTKVISIGSLLLLLPACLLLLSAATSHDYQASMGGRRVDDEDIYILARQVSDAYKTNETEHPYKRCGLFDESVLEGLESSSDPAVRNLSPICEFYNCIRNDTDVMIDLSNGIPRPHFNFGYDDMVNAAIPGLDLPFDGDELKASVESWRNAPRTLDVFEQGELGNWKIANDELLRTGLRRQIRDGFETWADNVSEGVTTKDVPVRIEGDNEGEFYPVITNISNRTLHHCMFVSRMYPDQEIVNDLHALISGVDRKGKGVFSDYTMTVIQITINLQTLDDSQQSGRFVYVDELAPGASISNYKQTGTLSRITTSFWSDECTVKDVQVFPNP